MRNYDFHFGLYRRSGMTQVLDILETLWMRLGPMLNLYLYRDGTPYSGEGHQHEVVIEALERRDARALKKSIRDDMIEGGRNFVRVLTEAEALA